MKTCPIMHYEGIFDLVELADHVDTCKDCQVVFNNFKRLATRRAGSTKSKAKAEAARLNGLKGGRPRTKR